MRDSHLFYGSGSAVNPASPVGQQRPATVVQPAYSVPVRWDALMLAIGVMILTYVWRFQELYPVLGTIRLPVLASLAAYLLYVINPDPRRALKHLKHPLMWLILAMLGFVVLSIPGSVYSGASFRFLTGTYIKTFLLTVLIAASVRSVVDVRRLAGVMVFGATVYSFYVLTRFEIRPNGRLGDLVYYDANDLAMVIVCTFPLAVYFANRARGTYLRIAALLILAMLVLAIVKSGSRGGFLGLIAVSAYLLFGFQALSKRVRVAAVAGAFLLLSFIASDKYWEIMETMLNPTEDYNWTAEDGRREVWKRGIGYMVQRPLTGVGAAQFPVAEGTLSEIGARQDVGIGFKWSAAHNSFVEIGAELGVFALMTFVALLVVAFRTARRTSRAPPGAAAPDHGFGHALAGAVVGYAIAGFFLSQGYSIYMYAIYGLILGLAKVTAGAPAAIAASTAFVPRGPGRRRIHPVGRGGLVRSAPGVVR